MDIQGFAGFKLFEKLQRLKRILDWSENGGSIESSFNCYLTRLRIGTCQRDPSLLYIS